MSTIGALSGFPPMVPEEKIEGEDAPVRTHQ
jgi:hypothetical protein